MPLNTQHMLWSLGLFLLFTTMPIAEVWFLKKQGVDILAHLRIRLDEGKGQFFFEAFGVVAFIIAQPIFFLWLFTRIYKGFGKEVMEAIQAVIT